MGDILLPAHVAASFSIGREAVALAGTEGRTYRSGDVILRRGHGGLEDLWAAGVLHALRSGAFRIERPRRARDGAWIVDGWTAWTFVAGRSAAPDDGAAVAQATIALHDALASVPYAPHLTAGAGFADRVAWDEQAPPSLLPAALDRPISRLAALRRPVAGLRDQVIHGDLNFHNILIASAQPPGFIDFSPYWRPPEFAAAIAAYWLGPYRGDAAVLRHFSHVRGLEQMLVRVALRQLLRLIQTRTDLLEWDEEIQAAERVLQIVE